MLRNSLTAQCQTRSVGRVSFIKNPVIQLQHIHRLAGNHNLNTDTFPSPTLLHILNILSQYGLIIAKCEITAN